MVESKLGSFFFFFFFLSSRGNPNMKPKAKPTNWLKKEKKKKQLSFLLPEFELVTFPYA